MAPCRRADYPRRRCTSRSLGNHVSFNQLAGTGLNQAEILHRWCVQRQSRPRRLGRADAFWRAGKELFGGELGTTNNRMELMAVIEALSALKRPCAVTLFLDSEYVRKGITEWIHGWKARAGAPRPTSL